MSFFQSTWPWIQAGELSLLFKRVDSPIKSGISTEARNSFFRLQCYIDNECNESSDPSYPSEKHIYETAITSLKQLMNSVCVTESNKVTVLRWPFMIESEYEKLLAERQPIALIILAHYAVNLDTFKGYWWLRGWGRQLILNIKRCIGEEERWAALMSWPLETTVEAGPESSGS